MRVLSKEWRAKWDGSWWDFVVIYLIPGPIWRTWMRWVHDPLRYGVSPWAKSSCDTCPECQKLENRD